MASVKAHDIVLLSTADWDNPFWTNKQHVAVALSRLGNRVLYVDSMGLRRPGVNARDLRRVWKRLYKAFQGLRKAREGIWIWSPFVLPWQGSLFIRRVNRFLIKRGLRRSLKSCGLEYDWLWTYNPMTTEFIDLPAFNLRVYHCVDEIKAQPGMPRGTMEAAEESLVRGVDIVFATSPELERTRRVWNPETHYFPNVADYTHFSRARDNTTEIPRDLDAIPRPRLGFVGAISGYKLNFHLIRHIAEARPDWSVVLIGQVGEGDPWTDGSLLDGLPNLHLLGPRAYSSLPGYLKGLDVALLPNNINEYTDAMFPMKFFEYLAAGCPVVTVDLKAIREFSDVVTVANTADDFVAAIAEVLAGNEPPLEHRLSLAQRYTYEKRTEAMLNLVHQVIAR